MQRIEYSAPGETSRKKEFELRKQVGSIKRMYCIDVGERDMGSFMDRMTSFTIDQARQVQQGKLDSSATKVPILFLEGPPLSAKTYTRREIIYPYLQEVFANAGVPVRLQDLHWDSIEDDLIEARIIAPQPGQPFKPAELQTVGTILNLLVAQALRRNNELPVRDIERAIKTKQIVSIASNKDEAAVKENVVNTFATLVDKYSLGYNVENPLTFVVVDKPGATGVGQVNIKNYSNNTVSDLLNGNYPFGDINRDAIFLGTAGLVGGASMDVLIDYRDGINNASSLAGANIVRLHYGFPLFSDEESWHQTQGGGSRAQTRAAMSVTYGLVRILYQRYRYSMGTKVLEKFRENERLPLYITQVFEAGSGKLAETLDKMEDNLGELQFDDFRQDIARVRSFTHQHNIYSILFHGAYKAGTAALLAFNLGLYESDRTKQPDTAMIAHTTAPIHLP